MIKKIRDMMESGGIYDFSPKYFLSYIKRFLQGQKDIALRYSHKSGKLRIKCYGNVKDREFKTAEMLLAAFEQIHYDLKQDLNMNVSCHDLCRVRKRHMYAYCKRSGAKNITTIPDYYFINWKEYGIYDYEKMRKEMIAASQKKPEQDKLFWIGNIKNSVLREKLWQLGKSDPRIEFVASNMTGGEYRNYVSMIDQTKYKYLLDVEGIAWSSRRKLLLFSGRPLFIVEDDWEEFFSRDLEPFIHYIPVKRDLSDLIKQLDWAESHEDEAQEIAKRAMDYAVNHLKRSDAINALAGIMLRLGSQD